VLRISSGKGSCILPVICGRSLVIFARSHLDESPSVSG